MIDWSEELKDEKKYIRDFEQENLDLIKEQEIVDRWTSLMYGDLEE